MRRLAGAALLAAICSIAQAQDVGVGIGVDDNSCGNWLHARDESRRTGRPNVVETAIIAWTQGYLTGMNLNHKEPRGLPGPTVVQAHLDEECRKAPTRAIWMHVDGLFPRTSKAR